MARLRNQQKRAGRLLYQMSYETDLELLKTLAALDGDTVVNVDDDSITFKNDCPTYGGYGVANSETGIQEGINQYTYNLLHPLDD